MKICPQILEIQRTSRWHQVSLLRCHAVIVVLVPLAGAAHLVYTLIDTPQLVEAHTLGRQNIVPPSGP